MAVCDVCNQQDVSEAMKSVGLFCHRPFYYARLKPRGIKAYENVSCLSCRSICKWPTNVYVVCMGMNGFVFPFLVYMSASVTCDGGCGLHVLRSGSPH